MEKLGSRQIVCVIHTIANGKTPFDTNTKLIARFICILKMLPIA
jgi:hypothetical protein